MKQHELFAIILLVAVGLIVAGCSTSVTPSGMNTATGNVPAPSNTKTPVPAPTVKTVEMNGTNKSVADQHQDTLALLVPNGVYTNDVTYAYHSGVETITISVTMQGDVITDASITPHNPNRVSARYIGGVSAALPDLVIGKRIDQLAIPDQVSGSSLTTAALKQYLAGLIKQ